MDNPLRKCEVCKWKWMPAASKRVVECPNCAAKEKTGESLAEKALRKKLESVKRMAERAQLKSQNMLPKKKPVIPNFSEKGLAKAKAVTAMKKELKRDAVDGAYYECKGCLNYFAVIDASHKIPLSQNTKLAAEKGNVTLLCRSCHNAWENGTVAQMIALKCFVADMQYLYANDNERFHKIFYRLLDEFEKTLNQKLEKVIIKLESFGSGDDENQDQ